MTQMQTPPRGDEDLLPPTHPNESQVNLRPLPLSCDLAVRVLGHMTLNESSHLCIPCLTCSFIMRGGGLSSLPLNLGRPW